MGRKCEDTGCPYLATDGTCLLPEYDLKEKCRAIERLEYEEGEDWTYINPSDYSGVY